MLLPHSLQTSVHRRRGEQVERTQRHVHRNQCESRVQHQGQIEISDDTYLLQCLVRIRLHLTTEPWSMQPLFRKIAGALPGMETLSSAKQEDMVDVNLKPTSSQSNSQQQAGSGCAC